MPDASVRFWVEWSGKRTLVDLCQDMSIKQQSVVQYIFRMVACSGTTFLCREGQPGRRLDSVGLTHALQDKGKDREHGMTNDSKGDGVANYAVKKTVDRIAVRGLSHEI